MVRGQARWNLTKTTWTFLVRNSKVTIPVPRSDNARLLARSLLAEISTSHLLGWRTKINTKSRGLLEVLSSPGQQTPTEDIGERGTEDSAFLDAAEQPPPILPKASLE
uniref:Uncharacterized protein n=1 Tax=Bionectria ochroleuca TaxID=29856 RepID=A0A8H7NQD2_BIOOC